MVTRWLAPERRALGGKQILEALASTEHTMRASLLALLAPLMASALVAPSARTAPRTVARMLPPPGGPMSPEQMKQAADAMKNLTPEQIDLLPAQQRAQVLALQQQMKG